MFVKAVGPELNPLSPDFHRREARNAAALPAGTPAPRLLWSHDEGPGGWVVLAFEDIDGRQPAQPWVDHELDLVLAAMERLAAALTPSPLPTGLCGTAGDVFARSVSGWRRLQAEHPVGLDAWSARHIDNLAGLESAAPSAVTGDTLLHLDVRADNILLTADRVYFVDWPHACVGARWVDRVLMAPAVAMQGGPNPEALLRSDPAVVGVEPRAITATVAALAGYFTRQAMQPPPPGLPTVRAFQAAQGAVARQWVSERTGWE